ncbi:hypothetical protein FHW96_002364 [Novosphingobium sp. SG751A]|uniref:ogr/Delta-like zinc finger family protein n=1 Tax=Novosphingobium sp. SG751A TaxID=2587000 RepID=UPI001556C7F7|nr:ogr/Delta-like zinc finger family protein [Novosphingobium sp. SG751A]NOW46206.1 hypothetical protein [Novosphingobium sp. SG751A]
MSGEGTLQSRPLIIAPMELRLRSGGTQATNRALVTCPDCDAPMVIRRSERQTQTLKTMDVICTNPGCGTTGGMELSFIHYYSRGTNPRPGLHLKACPRERIPQVLPPSPGAHDDPDQMSMFAPPD